MSDAKVNEISRMELATLVTRKLDKLLENVFGERQAFVLMVTGFDQHSAVQVTTNLNSKKTAKIMMEEILKDWNKSTPEQHFSLKPESLN